jgi:hypothetical protein
LGLNVTIPDSRTSRPGVGANDQLLSQCASTVSASIVAKRKEK